MLRLGCMCDLGTDEYFPGVFPKPATLHPLTPLFHSTALISHHFPPAGLLNLCSMVHQILATATAFKIKTVMVSRSSPWVADEGRRCFFGSQSALAGLYEEGHLRYETG